MLLAQIIYPTSFPGPYVAGKYRDFLCGSSALPTNNDLQIPQATQFELPILNYL